MHIILVDSFKGGVGKTTTSRWLARSFTSRGWRVLLTGLSVQNDAYPGVPVGVAGLREGLAGRMTRTVECQPGLYVWPGGASEPTLAQIDRLGETLVEKAADVGAMLVVLDGVNFLSPLSWEGVSVADITVVPAGLRLEQVASALKTLRAIRASRGGAVGPEKMLLTAVPSPSARTKGEEGLRTAIRQDYADEVFATEIRFSRRYEATGIPSTETAALVPGLGGNLVAADYAELTRELMLSFGWAGKVTA